MSEVILHEEPPHSNIQLVARATDPVEMQHAITSFVDAMIALPDNVKIDVETMHHFSGDIYARTVFVKAGTLVAGYRHKKECIVIVSLGTATVLTNEGMVNLMSPAVFVAPAGVQRVGYHQQDTVWTTIHITTERDIEKIEAELFDLSQGGK